MHNSGLSVSQRNVDSVNSSSTCTAKTPTGIFYLLSQLLIHIIPIMLNSGLPVSQKRVNSSFTAETSTGICHLYKCHFCQLFMSFPSELPVSQKKVNNSFTAKTSTGTHRLCGLVFVSCSYRKKQTVHSQLKHQQVYAICIVSFLSVAHAIPMLKLRIACIAKKVNSSFTEL